MSCPLGLIWSKPDKELGQGPLAAKQSVSRTPAELWNKNKLGELEKPDLACALICSRSNSCSSSRSEHMSIARGSGTTLATRVRICLSKELQAELQDDIWG